MTSTNDADRLFRSYHAGLVRYLARRLGDRDWAEDVAQETFVRALRQEKLTSERSWLYAVATNLVRDQLRTDERRRRRLELLASEEQERELAAPETTALERAQDAAMARRALDQLAERDRAALLMREEGLDYQEIAQALELSPGSVGTTLARARRRLAEAYESLHAREEGRDHAAS